MYGNKSRHCPNRYYRSAKPTTFLSNGLIPLIIIQHYFLRKISGGLGKRFTCYQNHITIAGLIMRYIQ